jgi:hypothetical protein
MDDFIRAGRERKKSAPLMMPNGIFRSIVEKKVGVLLNNKVEVRFLGC